MTVIPFRRDGTGRKAALSPGSYCGSPALAPARAIAAGDADVCIAGGAESMTRAPFVLPRASEEAVHRDYLVLD